jgi:hypothetical protein
VSSGDRMDITCACGEVFEAVIWQSANVKVSPQLRDAIVNGTMNVVTCPACGARFHVEVPLLYHDPENHEWIWVYPARYDVEAGQVAAEVEEMWNRIASTMPPDLRQTIETTYKIRLLFGMDALVAHLKAQNQEQAERAGQPPDITSDRKLEPGPGTPST